MSAKALTLVSHPLCPCVQRAAIVLAEKGVAWRARLAARPSVRDAVAADHSERLRTFLRARGSALGAVVAG